MRLCGSLLLAAALLGGVLAHESEIVPAAAGSVLDLHALAALLR
jgi:hypothetical protein